MGFEKKVLEFNINLQSLTYIKKNQALKFGNFPFVEIVNTSRKYIYI